MNAGKEYLGVEDSNQFRKDLASNKLQKEDFASNTPLFEALEKASSYVYNKAHAASYSYQIYKSAYIKANYYLPEKELKKDLSSTQAPKISNEEILAKSYLVNTRGISQAIGEDIRVNNLKHEGKQHPAIICFARNQEEQITGYQAIYLDKNSGEKIAKKSHGQIKGSFVYVNKTNNFESKEEEPKTTIIAEGVETALSLRETISNHNHDKKQLTIIASLGVSNISNYQPEVNEGVIIAADNDGVDANTKQVVKNAKTTLTEKCACVEIITPKEPGDWNDVLLKQGKEQIKESVIDRAEEIAQMSEEEISKNITDKKVSSIIKESNIESRVKLNSIIDDLRVICGERSASEFLDQTKTWTLEAIKEKASNLCENHANDTIKMSVEALESKYSLSVEWQQKIKIADFEGKSHTDKTSYLASLGDNKKIMKYLDKDKQEEALEARAGLATIPKNKDGASIYTDFDDGSQSKIEKIENSIKERTDLDSFRKSMVDIHRFTPDKVPELLDKHETQGQKEFLQNSKLACEEKVSNHALQTIRLLRNKELYPKEMKETIKLPDFEGQSHKTAVSHIDSTSKDEQVLKYANSAVKQEMKDFKYGEDKYISKLSPATIDLMYSIEKSVSDYTEFDKFREKVGDLYKTAGEDRVGKVLPGTCYTKLKESCADADKICKNLVSSQASYSIGILKNKENLPAEERSKIKTADFKGCLHENTKSYMQAISKDQQVNRYADSNLREQIREELKLETKQEVSQSRGIKLQ